MSSTAIRTSQLLHFQPDWPSGRRYRAEPTPVTRARRRRAEPPGLPRLEMLLVFGLATAAYFLVGLHLLDTSHLVVFDPLDRLTRAYMTWWDRPPKLAAIGFVYPPVQSLAFLPLALIKPLATSVVAVPLLGALAAALTLVSLDAVLVRCDLGLPLRVAVLVLFAIGPLWAWAATTGEAEVVYGFPFTAGLAAFVAWYVTGATRFLIGCGLAVAVAALTRYQLGIVAVFLGLMIAGVLIRRREAPGQVEGTIAAYGAPVVYGLAIWTMFSWIIQGDPFGWLSTAHDLSVNVAGGRNAGGAGFLAVVGHLSRLVVTTSPLGIAAFVGLVVMFVRRGNTMAAALAGLIALLVILMGLEAFISGDIASLTMATAIPVMLSGVIGAAWIYRSAGSLRPPVFAVTVGLLVLALPLTWLEMKRYPYQNQQAAFTRALFSGRDQSGTFSRGGYTVGVRPESQMADYINRTVGNRTHAILTDNAQTYAVILLSGKAATFLNRVDRGDGAWRSVLASPFGRVQYLLVACRDPGDLILQKYPSACNGKLAPELTPVFTTADERYALVRVSQSAATTSTPTTGP